MSHESPARVISYIVGFVLSVVSTLLAYLLVVNHVWPMSMLIIIIAVLAVVQLVVQLIFFLHLGDEKGPRWKLVTIVFAIIVVGILVVGSLWIMDNLNYNMMQFTPAQQNQYLKDNEGI
jgi:cytochrome o ubiquinol oxidase operon protein cyoD